MRWGVGSSGPGVHQPPAAGPGYASLATLESLMQVNRLVAGTINASRM